MAYTFRLPDLGEGVAEGEIVRWLVRPGQELAEDDPLVEIQTDKATVEVPSPAAGVVSAILVEEGSVVPVGRPLVVIGEGGEEAAEGPPAVAAAEASPAAPPRQGGAGGVRATPLVRRMAAELGVALDGLPGSGPGGRITEEDVRRVAAAGGAGTAPVAGGRREPLRGVRRAIAERLARSHREVPAVTVVEECDWSELSARRGELSYLPFALAAVAAALGEHPALNATLEEHEIVYHDRIDLGVAVQTEAGLVVPVLRGAERLGVEELAAEVRRLADGAHAGTLTPAELRGSTFSVTSAGRLAGLFATPLVNHPEVAILGVHRIAPRAAVVEGAIVVRDLGLLSCTFDHRVVDGAVASAFLLDVIERLQAPA